MEALIPRRAAMLIGAIMLLSVNAFGAPSDRRRFEAGDYDFVNEANAFAERLKPVATWKGLGGDVELIVLASGAGAHVDDCIQYLSQSRSSAEGRIVAILFMYRLPLPNYIAFVRKLLELYDHDLVSSYELMWAVAPPRYVISSVLFDNYEDPAVQSLFKDILSRPGLLEAQRASIEWARNGGDIEYKIKSRLRGPLRYLGIDWL